MNSIARATKTAAVSLFGIYLLVNSAFAAAADLTYSVSVGDPGRALTKTTKALLLSNLDAAITNWKRVVVMKGNMRIQLNITPTAFGTVDCASTSNTFVGYYNNVPVFEEGASYLIRTGVNLRPQSADIVIQVNPEYLKTQAWLDPRPKLRIDPVPRNKIDLISVFTHEMAHAFGFNGFINQSTGQLNPGFLSVFDTLIRSNSSGLYFAGVNATRANGGSIPLTNQNFYHYGNSNSSAALLSGIMNGISFSYGKRYKISAVDAGIMRDLGHSLR